MIHVKCRNGFYPNSSVKRQEVPDNKVKWNIQWLEYNPIEYTSPNIVGKPWADLNITDEFKPQWNSIEGNVNRISYCGMYNLNDDGRPLNPVGRTGLKGRGVLGRWGPNHAVDPIVTRWKRKTDNSIEYNITSCKPILQFIAIKRRDSGEWAFPGGMIDAGEEVNSALKREFMEETLNYLNKSEKEKLTLQQKIEEKFKNGIEIYKGYVDDWRNTDNAWMETTALHFHDETGCLFGSLPFHAGDDAVGVQWLNFSKNIKLFANHYTFIEKIVSSLGAHS